MASDQALLKSRVSKGRMTQEEADATLQRLTPVKTLEEAAGQADFVIEAVFENLEVKQELFARLDKICPQHTILASNSSTIVISKIAQVIERKDGTRYMKSVYQDGSKLSTVLDGKKQEVADNGKVVDSRSRKVYEVK